jgi:3-hydroxyisobutyrate dehydrogenase-like beta-hydroxyacid dehydrogenase
MQVSIIGVGNMGGGMTTNLLARGYQMHVHDIDAAKTAFYQEKGAVVHATGTQAAIQSIATIVCVVDAVQVDSVLFGPQGLAAAVPAGHTVLLCPTIAPQDTERIAAQLAQRGIHTIDAPMSGGPVRAADGSMSLMVACPDAVFAQHAVLINHLSSKVFRISQRVGDGARTKLVNNLLAGINLVGAAEALALAQRMGLDRATTLGVIEQSSGQSWIGTDRMRRALAGDVTPLAHMGLLAKDTALAVQAAKQLGSGTDYPGPLGEHASAAFAQAMAAGLAGEDDSALLAWLQTRLSGK